MGLGYAEILSGRRDTFTPARTPPRRRSKKLIFRCCITAPLYRRRNAYSETSGIQIDRFGEKRGKIVEEWAELGLLGRCVSWGHPEAKAGGWELAAYRTGLHTQQAAKCAILQRLRTEEDGAGRGARRGPYLRYMRRHRTTRQSVVFTMLQRIFLGN